ncbi:MAG: response regulator [Nitrospirae bacterium]|nr:response regulator [Nitrospirota bacterium]
MRNVLVVDDDAYSWRISEKALKPEGYELRYAGSGKQGLKLLEKEHFKIVLLALNIPDMDSIEVLGRINADWPDTKVVMIASFTAIWVAIHTLGLGAHDFIVKPFSPGTLLAVVNKFFER